ncbi:zinc finger protein Xfin [Megalops cyprinoides]|uniref:zinc finger protein Xfin n=1 Tax=Megalops cyprinoides TaxID=118141 RepID=UPI0018643A97|nr:zinc finger protein Xfin [Megalops cyprinoides]
MEYSLVDYTSCGEQVGGAAAFICTECGEGFSHYPDLLTHMAVHGPVEPFPYDCHTNGFGAPLEFALHENGMLTVVNRSAAEFNYTSPPIGKPSSPILAWSQASPLASQPTPMILASTQSPRLESQPTPVILSTPHAPLMESQPTSVIQAPPHAPPLESQPTPVILAAPHAPPMESQPTSVIQATPHAPSMDPQASPVILATPKAAESGNGVNTLVPPRPARFRCETCSQVFSTRLALQRHQRYRTLERSYKCTLCCRVFGEREELRQHLQDHAHERFYSCKQCGKRFLKQEALRAHQDERHGTAGSKPFRKFGEGQDNATDKSYPCKMCGLRFFWLSDLQSHLLSHAHGKISHVPSVSTYSPSATQRPPMQKETVHDTRSKPNIDMPAYKKNSSETNVPNLNTTFRPYRCGLCGNRFQQLSDLKQHHLSHQAQEDLVNLESAKQPIESRAASKETKPRGRPPRGNQANHNARVYPCKLCHRVFVHSSSLSRHMRYHKGTLHTCVFCGRHFPQRCDVRRHIAMYHNSEVPPSKPETEGGAVESKRDQKDQGTQVKLTVEKSTSENKRESNAFPCSKCGNTFSDKSELDSHSCNSQHPPDSKESSSSPKPRVTFQCNDCGKGFGLLCVYQRHQRYHRRELAGEVHKCPHCPRRFQHASSLKRHLDTHQNQSPGKDDKDVQTSSTTTSSQDPALALEHDDEEMEEEEDTEEEEGNGTAPAEVLYECTECTQTFSCLATFLQHQSAHGSDSIG